MAMNRQTKRMLQKQGQVGPDGEPIAAKRQPPAGRTKEQRTKPLQFVREVRAELRKVAWPTRGEVLNYSVIVLVTVLFMGVLVGVLDFAFGEGILKLLGA
jgi:preprotein translocase subunit SecE